MYYQHRVFNMDVRTLLNLRHRWFHSFQKNKKIITLFRPHQIKVFGICVESNFTLELKSTSGLLPVLRIRVSVQLVIVLVVFFFFSLLFRTIPCECLRNHCNAFPRTPVCQLDRARSFANTLKVMQNILLMVNKYFF